MGLFKDTAPDIKRVKLLGVREAHETLIFTTVNFTIYSFWVEYVDGSTNVIECSPSNPNDKRKKEKALFDKLIALANSEPPQDKGRAPSTASSISALDELQKLKDLHDSGIIPDALFEKKKSALLQQLSASQQEDKGDNVIILREQKRPFGEEPTWAFIDGRKLNANTDNSISLFLPTGKHTIQFKRALSSSKKLQLTVESEKHYRVTVNPKAFSLDAWVTED